MSERKELSVDIIVRPRGQDATIYSHAEGLHPGEIADWLDRAIIALGREREALAKCGIHGEPELWEDRADRDEVELAAKLHEMRRTAKGWRKDAIRHAIICIAQDVDARRIIRGAAGLLNPAESGLSERVRSTSALEEMDDKKTISPRLRVGEAKSEGTGDH